MSVSALKLSVIVPVYNEESSIVNVVQSMDIALSTLSFEYEIILVDDGSTDNTSEEMQKLSNRLSYLSVLTHKTNRGYGAALKSGISKSKFDRIMIIDADQTYATEDIPLLIEAAKQYDIVIGSRPYDKIPRIRRPAKSILKYLTQLLTDQKIPDLNSGFRIFKKEIVISFLPFFPDGFSFTSTLTIISITQNYTIKFIPTKYLKRKGKSKIKPIRDTLNFVQLIFRTILYINPLRIFLPASIIFFIISFLFYLYRLIFGGGFLVSTIITFICGFQLLVIGLLSDLIDKRLQQYDKFK